QPCSPSSSPCPAPLWPWHLRGCVRPASPVPPGPGARSMTKEMIISSNDHETRVAILEDDLVSELFVERERTRGVVGNVYKGRVSKVLPGMQSSFVDIGLERDGFLYVSDVVTPEEFEKLDDEEDEGAKAPRPQSSRGDASRGETPKEG